MPELSPRGRLIRDALIYTPLFVLTAGVALLMLAGVIDRAIIALVLLAGVAFLFGYQSIQSLRDLATRPAEIEGSVARRWSKRDAVVAKSYYITVNKAIYRIPVDGYMQIQVDDTVRIVAYPHTGTVISVERTGHTESARSSESEPAKSTGPALAEGRMRTLRTARMTPPRRRRDLPPDAISGPEKERELPPKDDG